MDTFSWTLKLRHLSPQRRKGNMSINILKTEQKKMRDSSSFLVTGIGSVNVTQRETTKKKKNNNSTSGLFCGPLPVLTQNVGYFFCINKMTHSGSSQWERLDMEFLTKTVNFDVHFVAF